jgi:hypothetical protein
MPAVAHQMQPEARQLALAADRRVGKPDRRHQVALGERPQGERVDLVGLAASGARPLIFWASAISTDQPSCSSVSWMSRAPVIDSTTAQTGSPWTSPMRRASVLSESESGGTARLVQVLAVLAEKTDIDLASTEIQSRVQH